MWHRIARDDFSKTGELGGWAPAQGDYYSVCTEYEVCRKPGGHNSDHSSCYLAPKYDNSVKDKWWTYRPLTDTLDLFLKFARLYDQPRTIDTVRDWVLKRGLLNANHAGVPEPVEETIDLFFKEVERAAAVLAMYEAVLNSDAEAAKRVLCIEFPEVTKRLWTNTSTGSGEAGYQPDYLKLALMTAAFQVSLMVERYSRQCLVVETGTPNPSRIRAGWRFYSLLGAMYLQMYWLMASNGEIRRCEYCGSVISLARPHPGARKPRRGKKTCNEACRQALYKRKKQTTSSDYSGSNGQQPNTNAG